MKRAPFGIFGALFQNFGHIVTLSRRVDKVAAVPQIVKNTNGMALCIGRVGFYIARVGRKYLATQTVYGHPRIGISIPRTGP